VRRRLKRETWWAIHLGMYLAFALAFAHEVVLGPAFVNHPLSQVIWSTAWAATAGTVLLYRFGLPIWRSFYYGLRVEELRPETDGITSIICRGRHLERLAISGGQFFEWRFLRRGLWWQAHPYTLSARPRPPYLRLTVKAVGDHSSALAKLRPGTRVAIEGPYGAFTVHARKHQRAALLAGGIGITAVRSLLEDMPKRSQPIVVWRLSSPSEAALESEVRQLVERLGGRLNLLVGTRDEHPLQDSLGLIPDIANRDVYVCGPEAFVNDAVELLYHQGIHPDALHREVYAL
jgi:ferredoxin-NADP reductase